MEKFIAYNVYARNSYGAAVAVALPDGDEKEVYLAASVDALLKKASDARLDWGMVCTCHCAECERLDAALRDLMVK